MLVQKTLPHIIVNIAETVFQKAGIIVFSVAVRRLPIFFVLLLDQLYQLCDVISAVPRVHGLHRSCKGERGDLAFFLL